MFVWIQLFDSETERPDIKESFYRIVNKMLVDDAQNIILSHAFVSTAHYVK